MKTIICLAALLVLVIGCFSNTFAATFTRTRGHSSPKASVGPSGNVLTINGTVGPQSASAPPYTGVVNNGTINGGSSTGLAVTGSMNVTNNSTITSNTTGISLTGGSSGAIINNGMISVTGSNTAAGISQ